MKSPLIKKCVQCGVEFRRPPSLARAKFCGTACWQAHHAAKETVCQQCGRRFRRGGAGRSEGTGGKFCSRECMGLGSRRRVEFRCRDCGQVTLRTPYQARRNQRCAACGLAFRAARFVGQPRPQVGDAAVREKWLQAQRAPERRERMREFMTGRDKLTEITRRGSPWHFKALHFCVRAPAGVTWRVDNLSAFVREHPDLFDPADVVNRSRLPASYQSRATVGLGKLRAVIGTRLSWKGWTLALGSRDELGRRVMDSGQRAEEGSGFGGQATTSDQSAVISHQSSVNSAAG